MPGSRLVCIRKHLLQWRPKCWRSMLGLLALLDLAIHFTKFPADSC